MGVINSAPHSAVLQQSYETLKVKLEDEICTIQIHRPDANNSINEMLIEEFLAVLAVCEEHAKIVVLEGSPEVFCFGADFDNISKEFSAGKVKGQDPEPLYNVWLKLATGPYISIAHVRGKANAGGIGFVAACDIVLCEEAATFSLSELLFDLIPACVLPFLIRKVGASKANTISLITQPIDAKQAQSLGLVDMVDGNSQSLLRRQLVRLRRLSKVGIRHQKGYMNQLDDSLVKHMPKALAKNEEIFSEPSTLSKIHRYITTGAFPWEKSGS
ncbi:enoyl-CoA hydratase [Pseudoalteromonas luteoviolacea]|uniref:Enoyl-CoA hydratase n=1 Tax=Pseudoalteromonas luteoviolacea TaxID=43657 RepID=A0A1C0TJT3_9GAMM|nr:enoyl-CoA hydratase/isomerase [Pseudoalteromonas luteoviolacea]OCQ18828.1 enoyl-CoA hydratase [Pseudoalteromonas luteoviolacea]